MSASTDDQLYRRLGAKRMTARSVIASTLLGATPPELPTRSLVATAELLGIAPGTARVAMSRMVAAGELRSTDDGYRLVAPTLLARQARQNTSREGATGRWDGSWRVLVVTGDARPPSDRLQLRSTLAALRFAELREGVWLRPDNLAPIVATQPAGGGPAGGEPAGGEPAGGGRALEGEAHGLVAMAARPDDPAELTASLWDLSAWASRSQLLLDEVGRLEPDLRAGDAGALADGFVVSAAVLRHFQADPLLPSELLPDHWPGPELRRRYDAFDSAFRSTLESWQRSHHRPPPTR